MAKRTWRADVFPAAHGAYGYVTFAPEAHEVVLLEGVAARHASPLLAALAEDLQGRGYHVERHLDPVDGHTVVGVALFEPPVAVWHEDHPQKTAWVPAPRWRRVRLGQATWPSPSPGPRPTATAGRPWEQAVRQFRAALLYRQEMETYLWSSGAVDAAGVNQLALHLVAELLPRPPRPRLARARHRFASALTEKGPVHTLGTAAPEDAQRILLLGPVGAGKATLLRHLAAAAELRGEDFIAYHCPLAPPRVEHLVLPRLSLAFLSSAWPHAVPQRRGDRTVDLGAFVDQDRLRGVRIHLERADALYRAAVERGVSFLAEALSAGADTGDEGLRLGWQEEAKRLGDLVAALARSVSTTPSH